MPRRRSQRPLEVFLSRAEKETPRHAATLERFRAALQRRGVAVWTAPTGVRDGTTWHDEIGKALRRCDWFVVALTKRSVRRPWVKQEVLYALQQVRYRQRILPLILEPCDTDALSWTLCNRQMIKFRNSPQLARDALTAMGVA